MKFYKFLANVTKFYDEGKLGRMHVNLGKLGRMHVNLAELIRL